MSTKTLAPAEARALFPKLPYRACVIFPVGRPILCYATRAHAVSDRHFKMFDVVMELPEVVEGHIHRVEYVWHSEYNVMGGMVTWFKVREEGGSDDE